MFSIFILFVLLTFVNHSLAAVVTGVAIHPMDVETLTQFVELTSNLRIVLSS
jgi:hypothetical protein